MAKCIEFSKKGGQVDLNSRLDSLLSTLKNGNYVLTITRKKEHRSLSQNALMWMWFRLIGDELDVPVEDIHDYYVAAFLRRPVMLVDRVEICTSSTSKLNTDEMRTFLDKIKIDAAQEFGIELPLPEDQHFEIFAQQYNL